MELFVKLIKNESGYNLEFNIENLNSFTISDLKKLIKKTIPGISEVSFTGIEDNSLLTEYVASIDLSNLTSSSFPACIVLTPELTRANTSEKEQIKIEINASDMLVPLVDGASLTRLCEKFLSLNVPKDGISKHVTTTIKWNENSIKIGSGFIYKSMAYGKIPKVLDKLAYIFYKLEIGVIKEISRVGFQVSTSLVYEGSLAIDKGAETKSLNLSPFALFKLFPSLSNRYVSENKGLNKRDQIKVLCANYLGHTWDIRQTSSKPHSETDLNAKEHIIKQLYYAKNLREAKNILSTTENQTILNKNRTPTAYLILKTIGILLSFPISVPVIFYYGLKGKFTFFTPESKLLADKVNLIINNPNIGI